MRVTLAYYGALRGLAGKAGEDWEAGPGGLPALYASLRSRYGWPLGHGQVGVAVNDDFADWGRELRPGDHVVFIPPVSGG